MTELLKKVPRCQQCGLVLRVHGESCVPVTRSSFDMSQEHLAEQDRLVGELLSAILQLRSVESVQNSFYGSEFFALLDSRRRLT